MRGRKPGRDTITVVRAPITTDAHNNDRRDWAAATETVVEGCEVQPQGSQENLVNQDQVLIAYKVFAPAGTDVKATDRVKYDGETFEVFGHPGAWKTRGGRLDYVAISLVDWKGGASA